MHTSLADLGWRRAQERDTKLLLAWHESSVTVDRSLLGLSKARCWRCDRCDRPAGFPWEIGEKEIYIYIYIHITCIFWIKMHVLFRETFFFIQNACGFVCEKISNIPTINIYIYNLHISCIYMYIYIYTYIWYVCGRHGDLLYCCWVYGLRLQMVSLLKVVVFPITALRGLAEVLR